MEAVADPTTLDALLQWYGAAAFPIVLLLGGLRYLYKLSKEKDDVISEKDAVIAKRDETIAVQNATAVSQAEMLAPIVVETAQAMKQTAALLSETTAGRKMKRRKDYRDDDEA